MLQIHRQLNDKIKIGDTTYEVSASFDNILTVLKVSEEMRKDNVSALIFANVLLKLLIGNILAEFDLERKLNVIEVLFDKYLKTEKKTMVDISGEEIELEEPDSQDLVFDYEEDSELIYSAFMQTYGIDLIEEQGKLHWFKFKALLNGIPDNTRLTQVIGYRSYNPSDDKKSYKQQMLYLKGIYRLQSKEENIDG